MNHSMILTLQQRPEVLERILRTIRHRGFTVTQLQMRSLDNACLAVDVVVSSERAIELLCTQLTKLVDVVACRVLPPQCLSKTA